MFDVWFYSAGGGYKKFANVNGIINITENSTTKLTGNFNFISGDTNTSNYLKNS